MLEDKLDEYLNTVTTVELTEEEAFNILAESIKDVNELWDNEIDVDFEAGGLVNIIEMIENPENYDEYYIEDYFKAYGKNNVESLKDYLNKGKALRLTILGKYGLIKVKDRFLEPKRQLFIHSHYIVDVDKEAVKEAKRLIYDYLALGTKFDVIRDNLLSSGLAGVEIVAGDGN